MTNNENYKEKLIALCEGLRLSYIGEFIESDIDTIRGIGKHVHDLAVNAGESEICKIIYKELVKATNEFKKECYNINLN